MEMLPSGSHCVKKQNVHRYIEKMADMKRKLYKEAQENIGKAQKRQEEGYNRKHAVTMVNCVVRAYPMILLTLTHSLFNQELKLGTAVLLRNSARDGRKGDKF